MHGMSHIERIQVLFTGEETKLHIQVGMTERVVAFGKFWSQKILLKFTSF